MGVKVTVKGIEQVQKNLNKELSKLSGNSLAGMIRASILIRRDMEETSPKTPIDTGNLRASWFTVTSKGTTPDGGGDFKGDDASKMKSNHSSVVNGTKSKILGKKPVVSMGFTANYAAAVHENMEATFKRPGAGAKFLEKAIKRNKRQILKLIAESSKIK